MPDISQIKELVQRHIKQSDVNIIVPRTFYSKLLEMLKENPKNIIHSAKKIKNLLIESLQSGDASVTMPDEFYTELENLLYDGSPIAHAWGVSSAKTDEISNARGGLKSLKHRKSKNKKSRKR